VWRVIPFPAVSSVFEFVSLHDAVAPSRRRHRRLVASAGQWALARGLSLPPDHVALWAAAAEHGGRGDVDGVTGPWYATELQDLLSLTLPDWCAETGCLAPADLPQSLGHLYRFLADSGRLHAASDSADELNTVLLTPTALNRLCPRPTEPGPVAA
jgi:hypothetical protein